VDQSQVQQLIDAVKSVSPGLWAAAQHQVQVQIEQDWMWGGLCLGLTAIAFMLSVLSFVMLRRSYDDHRYNGGVIGWTVGCMLLGCVGILFVILAAVNFNDLIAKYNAPDYAAIQNLANLLPTGSSK